LPVLGGGDLAAKDHGDHLITQIFVVDAGVRIEQRRRAATRNQRVMKLPIVALPQLRVRVLAGHQKLLQPRKLVMRGDNPAFPFHVAGRE
jgi:hypothetical protein